MKYLKRFESYLQDDELQDELQGQIQPDNDDDDISFNANHEPYVKSNRKIGDVFVVDSYADFDDNPLFYVWSEYPKYSQFNKPDGFLKYTYEFYTDSADNKYFVASDVKEISDAEIEEKIKNHDWNYSRNVDEFVNGADKDSYKQWLDLIS
jgi:hypothetical protein